MADTVPTRGERARALGGAVLDARPDAPWHDAVEAARLALSADSAGLSAISDRQVMLSVAGAGPAGPHCGDQFGLEDSICTNVVRQDSTIVIPDARTDPRVSSLPGVRLGMVGSYLGTPVRVHGMTLAVLCVIDRVERQWSADDAAVLERHALLVAGSLAGLADGCDG